MSAAARPALRLATPCAAPDRRSDLARLCAGEPVALDRVDLIAFVNGPHTGLDPDIHPDNYTLAEIALERFHSHVGTFRRTKGDRAQGIASDMGRYILPFAIELAAARPPGRAGIAHLRVPQAEQLQSILSGDKPLPAATVAGDRLRRVAITCLWLTPADAARVCTDGETGLRQAMASGRLTSSTDRDGRELVFAADLRAAGLLDEPDRPHGLAVGTAAAIIKLLSSAIERGRDLGAGLVGNYTTLRAVEPLAAHRKRPADEGPRPYTSLDAIVGACTLLTATSQLATWLMRLVGLRIGEAYGLFVTDFDDDGVTAWLKVKTQGGTTSLARDKAGRLVASKTKDHTKTLGSTRRVPICRPLADLIAEYIRMFHTDPATGQVNTGARLIAGLRSEDASGSDALRTSLESAFQQRLSGGLAVDFDPHDLRAGLITDLRNAGVDERLAEWYTGHAAPKTVHGGYDLGPEELEPVVRSSAPWWKPSLAAPTCGCPPPRSSSGGSQRGEAGAATRCAPPSQQPAGSFRAPVRGRPAPPAPPCSVQLSLATSMPPG
jgi:integrase